MGMFDGIKEHIDPLVEAINRNTEVHQQVLLVAAKLAEKMTGERIEVEPEEPKKSSSRMKAVASEAGDIFLKALGKVASEALNEYANAKKKSKDQNDEE